MYEARIRDSLPRVEERIRQACERAGRRDEVRLIAVTKGHPVDAVRAAMTAGLKRCGENRVAEMSQKIEIVGRHAVEWHLIGHLQRNKAADAIELSDLIHSVDSLRLAQQLSTDGAKVDRTVRCLVQVNTSGEASKSGIDVDDDSDLPRALAAIAEIAVLPNLAISGLMTMAPFTSDERVLRSTFARTRRLLEQCSDTIDGWSGRELSMGMTNDFEIAIEEGSTMVRLGTILFGERAQ